MFSKLIPREHDFFEFFDAHASLIAVSAVEFASIAEDFSQLQAKVEKIRTLESDADSVAHDCVETLHKTFITPLDRDEIYALTSALDDIIDHIEAAADCLVVYKIREMLPGATSLARILVACTQEVEKAVKELRDLGNFDQIRGHCVVINRLENEADLVLRNAVGLLFEEQPDAKLIIKWKEILEHLEDATDRCEDVANILEGIILEQA